MQGRTAGFVLAALLLAAPLALLSAYGDGEGDEYGEGYGGAAGMDDYGGGGDDYGDYDAAGGDDSLSAPIRGVTELDDITFNKIVDGSRPVLVEFYGERQSAFHNELPDHQQTETCCATCTLLRDLQPQTALTVRSDLFQLPMCFWFGSVRV